MVVLTAREGDTLKAALAVTTDADAALQAAQAAAEASPALSPEAPQGEADRADRQVITMRLKSDRDATQSERGATGE